MDGELRNRVRAFAELEVIRIVAARRKKSLPLQEIKRNKLWQAAA
jgi:hypothetical protein